jgi:hypothetical protein
VQSATLLIGLQALLLADIHVIDNMVPHMVPSVNMSPRRERLFNKATTSPQNLTFDELCALAEEVGFVFRRRNGSHRIYKHPIYGTMMNFQPDNRDKSKAKDYQIKQLLAFIDEFDLMEG